MQGLDLFLVLIVYFISWFWQAIGFAFIFPKTKDLADGGWGLGRLISTVMIAVVIFALANLGLKTNTNYGLILVIVPIVFTAIWIIHKYRDVLIETISRKRKIILIEEALMVMGLMFMTTMRGFNPNIDSLEKYMDFGFIYQYLLTPDLPIKDMWFAGEAVNYYSFGHYWVSIMLRFLPVKPAVGFNIALAIVFALTLVLSFAASANMIKNPRGKITGGIISALLITLGSNTHIWWFMLKNGGLWEGNIPYWYGVATRFIEKTIHEFPAYTFTIGDLHAHLMDIPFVLAFILVLSAFDVASKKIFYSMWLGVILGIMTMTNTWDAGVYILLTGIYLLITLKKLGLRNTLLVGAVIISTALAVSSPWWVSFSSITKELAPVTTGSPLWQLVALWSVQLIFGGLAWILFPKNYVVKSLVITAILLIVIPETFYLVDIYYTFPRANTMFKLTFQAFILLSLVGGAVFGEVWRKKDHLLMSIILSVLIGGLLIYPFTSYSNFYLNFKNYRGLDGEKWLATGMQERYGAIEYLKKNRDGRNIIEHPGKSFTLSSATPVFSGVPGVLGWVDHEWLWRADRSWIDERINDINIFYGNPESSESAEIVKKYNIGWVLVGREERKYLEIGHYGLSKLGEIVWENGDNYLLRISPRDN